VGSIAINRYLRRLGRGATALVLVLALGGAVALAHADPAMAGMHDAMAMSTLEACVGVLTAVGAAVAAVCVGLIALGRWRTPPPLASGTWTVRSCVGRSRARAGPSLLPLVCVWRR